MAVDSLHGRGGESLGGLLPLRKLILDKRFTLCYNRVVGSESRFANLTLNKRRVICSEYQRMAICTSQVRFSWRLRCGGTRKQAERQSVRLNKPIVGSNPISRLRLLEA